MSVTDTDRAPEEVFSLLGNETRVDILRALWKTHNSHTTFSELYDAVDNVFLPIFVRPFHAICPKLIAT